MTDLKQQWAVWKHGVNPYAVLWPWMDAEQYLHLTRHGYTVLPVETYSLESADGVTQGAAPSTNPPQ